MCGTFFKKEINMKKVTLSAAILALTMMGCSETGVDNSMTATTSDAQKEKNN